MNAASASAALSVFGRSCRACGTFSCAANSPANTFGPVRGYLS